MNIKLFLFLVLSQSFIFSQESPSYKELHKQVLPFADYTKATYDQAKAIEMIDAYLGINNEKLTMSDKIRLLVLSGDLFGVHAKHEQQDDAKSYAYYEKACALSNSYYSEVKLRCMRYLVNNSKSDDETFKKMIAFNHLMAWLMLQSESDLNKIVLPETSKIDSSEKIKKFLNVVSSYFDSTTEEILDLSKGKTDREAFISQYYKPGVDWVVQKYGVKIIVEEKKAEPQNITKIPENQTPVITAQQNLHFLDQIRYKELTKANIEIIAKFLENEEHIDPKNFQGGNTEWLKETRVCDYAYLALEHRVYGNSYAWNRLRFNLKTKDKKLEEWRSWWKDNRDLTLAEIGRKIIDKALIQPITIENNNNLENALFCWIGWNFEMGRRLLFTEEKPETIIAEIKTWWEAQKEKDVTSWKKSAKELKDSPKYLKIREICIETEKVKSSIFEAKRTAEKEKFKKESPELIEFFNTVDKQGGTKEGIKKALEMIKINKPKLKGTTFEEEYEKFEQRLLSDPILTEK